MEQLQNIKLLNYQSIKQLLHQHLLNEIYSNNNKRLVHRNNNNTNNRQTREATNNIQELHPLWQAARKSMTIVPFQGTKITF
jgi:hypothetical protein